VVGVGLRSGGFNCHSLEPRRDAPAMSNYIAQLVEPNAPAGDAFS
jgi:hypothetical protein